MDDIHTTTALPPGLPLSLHLLSARLLRPYAGRPPTRLQPDAGGQQKRRAKGRVSMPNRIRTKPVRRSASTVLTRILPADFVHQRHQDSPEAAPRQELAQQSWCKSASTSKPPRGVRSSRSQTATPRRGGSRRRGQREPVALIPSRRECVLRPASRTRSASRRAASASLPLSRRWRATAHLGLLTRPNSCACWLQTDVTCPC